METQINLTEQKFWALPEPIQGGNYELIQGQAIQKVSPKYFHSSLQAAFLVIIRSWCKKTDLGRIGTEWSVRLELNGERWIPCPDLTYVSYKKLPKSWRQNEPCPIPCDLAIEITSPDQTFKQLEEKGIDYFLAGVLRVWIVDPEEISLTVLHPSGLIEKFAQDTVIEDDLFPGLNVSANDVFGEADLL